MNLPNLDNNRCSVCGSASLILASEFVEYSPLELNEEGELAAGYGHTEANVGPESVRCYCAECGEYHQVPEHLK